MDIIIKSVKVAWSLEFLIRFIPCKECCYGYDLDCKCNVKLSRHTRHLRFKTHRKSCLIPLFKQTNFDAQNSPS